MRTFILYPMFPRLRDHLEEGEVKIIRAKDWLAQGYDTYEFTVAVVACIMPGQDQASQKFKWLGRISP